VLTSHRMPHSDQFDPRPDQMQLHEILMKIVIYQYSLPDRRAVELDELRRKRVLSPDDLEFLASHSVTYKPHPLSAYHGLDMLQMPTEGGGCVFVGPCGSELTKRSASVSALKAILESFLKLPRPRDELLFHIELTEHDGIAVSPDMVTFNLRSPKWRERLPAIRCVAEEFGLKAFQDREVQGSWTLTFRGGSDAGKAAATAVALLVRGCGFSPDTNIAYSAGALDEADSAGR
jgi:hypothetical protein